MIFHTDFGDGSESFLFFFIVEVIIFNPTRITEYGY